jgi:hypothetical protein
MNKNNCKPSSLNHPFTGQPLSADTANPFKQKPASSAMPVSQAAPSNVQQPSSGSAPADFVSRIVASSARPGQKRPRVQPQAAAPQDIPAKNDGLPPQIRRILETPLHVFDALKDEQAAPGTAPLTYIGFVLDRSGSMESGKSDTIEGFNTQINTVKAGAAEAGETRVGMVDFSTTPSVRYMGVNTSALQPLTAQNYVPDGYTALYDGVGMMIAELLAQPHMESPETAVLVTIFTDGEENASNQYSSALLKDLITKLEATGRWTFALVGPTEGVMDLADMLAVDRSNTTGFDPDSLGDRVVTQAKMAVASASYMMSRSTGMKARKGLYSEDGDDRKD